MVQNTIRIECNPYTKQVKYYWKNDGGTELWSDLSESKSSPFAKSKPSYKGFAEATIGHKAYEILNVINSQYNKGKNGIEIIVDGTHDDLDELNAVIDSSFSDSGMRCVPGDMYMLPAKEVMPQIEDVFSSLGMVLSKYSDDEISGLISRYSETVKPEISLCVMGLYSSGKSSFINSLIGKEILPSASDPATAKIYKISCEDSVWVCFQYDDKEYRLEFFDNEWKLNVSPDAEIVSKIIDEINKVNGSEKKLYVALTVLNEYAIVEGKKRQSIIESLAEKEGLSLNDFLEKNTISSLIEQEIIEKYRLADIISMGVPFCDNTSLPIKDFKFVIFDTPGSNSEMHKEHVEILKKSLEDRTNGLPIFVTNADTLDSTDNAPVINLIETLGDSLDGTSTMIVVNKADEKSKKALMEKREKTSELKVTSWKPSRIYFVSSIISLGQKIENPIEQESWMDQEYADVYYDNYKKFDGSDERSLLQLYKYNILPINVQNTMIETAEGQEGDEAILWNAGIRSIELEIGTFGERFALYNKCVQAQKYLEAAIERLTARIGDTSKEIDETQKQIEDEIAEAIKELEKSMQSKCDEKKKTLDTAFGTEVVGPYVKRYLDTDRISGVIGNAINEAKSHPEKWKESGIFKGAQNSTEYVKYVKRLVSNRYDEDLIAYAKDVNKRSDTFWEKGIQELKELLLQIVYASEKLTDEQKQIAKDAVMEAGKMQSTHSELKLGEGAGTAKKQFLWVKWDEFSSDDAKKTYRQSLKDVIDAKNATVKTENTKAFGNWNRDLINKLRAKLSQLNPRIVELNQKLVRYQNLEKELDEQLAEVKKAQFDIRSLLEFKEAE